MGPTIHSHSIETRTYKNILNVLDATFGLLFCFLFLCLLVAFFKHQVGPRALMSFMAFALLNFLASFLRKRSDFPMKIELTRYFLNIFILCIFTLLWIKGPFEPFWYGYFMIAFGGIVTNQVTWGRTLGIAISSLTIISYILVNTFFIESPNWIVVSMNSVTMFMFSILYIRILALISKSYLKEINKGIKLQKTLAETRRAQETVIIQSKMYALGSMAISIAHEINNPLTIMSSTLQVIDKKTSKVISDKIILKEMIKDMHDAYKRIANITSGMKILSGETLHCPFEFCVLKDIMSNILGALSKKIKKTDTLLSCDINDFNFALYLDRDAFSQAIINLLNNAIYATQNKEKTWIKIVCEEQEKNYALIISDNGSGIGESIKPKIFDPFFTTKEIGDGSGMGLGISKKIIEMHGGEIELLSAPDFTSFKIKLPKTLATIPPA